MINVRLSTGVLIVGCSLAVVLSLNCGSQRCQKTMQMLPSLTENTLRKLVWMDFVAVLLFPLLRMLKCDQPVSASSATSTFRSGILAPHRRLRKR